MHHSHQLAEPLCPVEKRRRASEDKENDHQYAVRINKRLKGHPVGDKHPDEVVVVAVAHLADERFAQLQLARRSAGFSLADRAHAAERARDVEYCTLREAGRRAALNVDDPAAAAAATVVAGPPCCAPMLAQYGSACVLGPPPAETRAVALTVTASLTMKTVPPAPPPESLPLPQPRGPSALTVPLIVTEPVSVGVSPTNTIRPPPGPPTPTEGMASKPSPSRHPLSPPDAPLFRS